MTILYLLIHFHVYLAMLFFYSLASSRIQEIKLHFTFHVNDDKRIWLFILYSLYFQEWNTASYPFNKIDIFTSVIFTLWKYPKNYFHNAKITTRTLSKSMLPMSMSAQHHRELCMYSLPQHEKHLSKYFSLMTTVNIQS